MSDRRLSARRPTDLEIMVARQNFTAKETTDEHFFRCWQRQDCKGCLAEDRCSWCPMTSACVPNPYAIPLLAPAWNEDVCPHWAERWELRTRPLGCQVSTITSLTSIISIVSTLVVVLLVTLLFVTIRWARRRSVKEPGWWRVWQYDWRHIVTRRDNIGEQDPLLGQDHSTRSNQGPLG
ncbi:hypothetical protein CGCSCA4_v009261 [Colletotrichum siamense]|uniref:PSI domain-containing protein n=1 Tax=Colletotrichum siamense TaxID=690259 RepID=A0A9P5ENW6_COLSI|nr:hypothetical protein CGCSCA4_v009261 [Colletotrichum siamense]KAF4855632.1 hypothetical protein CGCSCA2_v009004 [Colletotrichum siamense]